MSKEFIYIYILLVVHSNTVGNCIKVESVGGKRRTVFYWL